MRKITGMKLEGGKIVRKEPGEERGRNRRSARFTERKVDKYSKEGTGRRKGKNRRSERLQKGIGSR
jgi:hypothetical protein